MRLLSQRYRSDGSLKYCCCYCLIDVALAIFVGVLCYLLFSGFVPPYKRGFYCHDETIRLPFKENTVSVKLLLFVSIAVPIVLILWYQMWTFLFVPSTVSGESPPPSSASSSHSSTTFRSRLSDRPWRIFWATGTSVGTEYFFGLMVVVALMHFGKSTFGVLRPHFIDICRPNASLLTCEQLKSSPIADHQQRLDADDADFGRTGELRKIAIPIKSPSDPAWIYVDEPFCTTKDAMMLKVARESFPSGHTAVAVYACLFVLAFIRDRTRRIGANGFGGLASTSATFCPTALRYAFSLIYLVWTCVVCVTRVTDHWHHWTDVAGGVVLGIGVGAVLFFRKDSAFRNSLTQGKAVDY